VNIERLAYEFDRDKADEGDEFPTLLIPYIPFIPAKFPVLI
jgi:hypothetical protein